MQQTQTIKITPEQARTLRSYFGENGFSEDREGNEHISWRFRKNGLVVTAYNSGSLVIQGTEDFSTILFQLKSSSRSNFSPHFGSDEVGKGDYFGPLVICCVFMDENGFNLASDLGVTDSKNLSDAKICDIYSKLKSSVIHNFVVKLPKDYNLELREFRNVSYYLARLHKEAVEATLFQAKVGDKALVVIDQFSTNKGRLENEFKNLNITLEQFHKGESNIVVALASVFARARFLEEMDRMSDSYGFKFPKGASDVIDAGREFVKQFGSERLNEVAKTSFKTTQSILSFF
ncbi:ribonuclease HIII [bacterium]|nr:ribonuclease HIII [bacterium]